jgi:hypothetical protein
MKKLSLLFVFTLLISVNVAWAAGDEATEAKVVRVSGTATVLLPGESEAVPLVVGMSLPAGATIMTGDNSEVDIKPLAGGLAAIKPKSTVNLEQLSVNRDSAGVITKQTATLSLKAGNLISTLDPGRKAINNYGVRTPKGVAAARGTVYSVSVQQSGSSVATLSGTVTLTPVGGGTPIVIDIGTGLVISGDAGNTTGTPRSLAQIVQEEADNETGGGEDSITSAIAQAVSTVAKAVENNDISSVTDGASDANSAVSILSAVVNVAAQANPNQAATFASQAVTAVTAPGSSVAAAGASAATSAVTEAAVQGAVQGAIAKNAGNAAEATSAAQAVTNAVVTAATTAAGTSASRGGATVTTATIASAASTGAATGTSRAAVSTGTTATTPSVTTTNANGETTTTTTTISATGQQTTTTTTATGTTTTTPTTTTPITPVDPTVVSPSGGR